jgi:hypothetical protein
MDRIGPQMPDWVVLEETKLALLRGEERLARMWSIVERLGLEGNIDAKIVWLRNILRVAWKETRLDYTLRAFTELRRIHAEEANYAWLSKDVRRYYKWLVEELPEYADVPLATLITIFDEMTEFYRKEIVSLRPVYSLRCRASVLMGKTNDADVWYKKWQATPGGESDDCAACEADRKITYLAYNERFEEALAEADPILRGQAFCEDSPETLTRLVGAALHMKRTRLAVLLLRASEKHVRRTRSMLSSLAAHVVYQLMIGKETRARRMAIISLRRVKETINDFDRFAVYRSCGMWAALSLIAGTSKRGIPRWLMPDNEGKAGEMVELPDVAGVCLEQAREIAVRFDARNQTSRYADRLTELETAIRRVVSSDRPRER